MRLKNSAHTMSLTVGMLLLGGSLWATPTFQRWALQQGDQADRIRLEWSEPGQVQVDEFPAARQVVVTIPGAVSAPAGLGRLPVPSSSNLEDIKYQDVTLSDGRPAAAITLTLRRWAKVEPTAGRDALILSLTHGVSTDAGMTLSNADLSALEAQGRSSVSFGSERAPAEGAGQAPDAAGAGNTGGGSTFYVPPDVTASPQQQANVDQGSVATAALLKTRIKSLDFQDADLANIIRVLAAKTQMNLIMAPNQVNGKVTMKLQNVEVGDAMNALLKSSELATKVEPGGIIRIVPLASVRSGQKETVIRAIPVNWVTATDLEAVLKPFMQGEGTGSSGESKSEIKASVATNSLIVRDLPENVSKLQEIISHVDRPEKQVKMEVRLVDMTDSAQRDLGFRAQAADNETMLVKDPIEFGGKVGSEVAELSKIAGNTGQPIGIPTGAGLNLFTNNTAEIFGNKYLFQTQLAAQERLNQAVTLANPTILSLNNRLASVEIIRQEPYITAQQTSQNSIGTVEFKDIGTKINLTPLITNNGYVQMTIEPDVSIRRGTSNTGVPIVDKRTIKTSVIVKDEQTVALGGLRQVETTNAETGIPFLVHVPVLSWLFKTASDTQFKLDLVLFVTPHILKDPEPSVFEQGLYEKIDYNWDLPDYYFDQTRAAKGPKEAADPRFKH